ncbi:glycosyltransferase family 39 protein [Patescibacteria group bacterium]|nr:glycosyltransferase family 39 protein [Patescibacteria group bacterium]
MKKIKNFWKFLIKNKPIVIVLIIFIFELFLRFNQIDVKNPFGYDQVDNAWAAMNLIVNGKIPLVGFEAKGNTGIFIGPVYYYLISFFYWIFNLNPIASGVFAGLTSIFTFWSLFYVVKKIFSWEVAIIAVFINTVVFNGILFDRVQGPVNFIPGVSILIFYFLYKVITGNSKYIIALSLVIGFSFQLHFTSVFFPLIVILSLPFFPRNKETIKYALVSIPLFLIWLIPNAIAQLREGNSQTSHLANYLSTYYHGFHLIRLAQLLSDSLIQFEEFFAPNKILKPLKYLLVPGFFIFYLYRDRSREKLMLCFLIGLWFLIPLLVFTTYAGEITDYYFSINRFVALFIISYFLARLWMIKNIAPKIAVLVMLSYIAVTGVSTYLPYKDKGLTDRKQIVLKAIKEGRVVGFQQGVPESYIYYYFMRQRGVAVYETHKK